MSGFKALNIESDDESDVEIDDTKELQIEDALKLYQNALKYHAEGPASFEQAAEAYEQLFQSDIFQYPESQTELRRIELYGPVTDADGDDLWQDGLPSGGPAAAGGGMETGPSTLPQILHLSHKNYAQFKLEYLTARLETFNFTLNQILSDATAALDHFVEALDKDDTDLDLWRRTASVGGMLESQRVARFCLEAVLDGDDDGLGGVLSLPGLEESLAGEQICELVRRLEDHLSILQNPLSASKRRVLSKMLRDRLNPYPNIAQVEKTLREQLVPDGSQGPKRVLLKAPHTWAGMGDILLRQLIVEQHGTHSLEPGAAISFDLSSVTRPAPKVTEAPPLSTMAEPEPIPREQVERSGNSVSVGEQFPGLNNGQPLTQPQIAAAGVDMHTVMQGSTNDDVGMTDPPTIALPTRKRSGDAAGLNDSPEEGRTKSKRTRTRESTNAEDSRQAIIDANIQWEYEQQLNEIQAADDWMFETVGNLFERIGVVGFDVGRNVREEMQHAVGSDDDAIADEDEGDNRGLKLVKSDLHAFLNNYSDQLAHFLMMDGESLDVAQGTNALGFGGSFFNSAGSRTVSKAPLMPEDGLFDLLEEINDGWFLAQEVAWRWLSALLRPTLPDSILNSYREYLWSEELKTMIVRTLVNFDESMYDRAQDELDTRKRRLDCKISDHGLAVMIETIFELHLDIYCLIKQPNSGVNAETVLAQGDRLQRWSELARELIYFRSVASGVPRLKDELGLRFLWAITFNIAAATDVAQDHIIECMTDLKAILVAVEEPNIHLQNNAIMPELSVAALDREISRLTTRDFFLKVTNLDLGDPVAVIHGLEPLLEALDESHNGDKQAGLSTEVSPELVRFIKGSNVSVRLLLWQRLRDAYLAIDYRPMVVSCYFKIISLLVHELKTTMSTGIAQGDRQVFVLKTLRLIQEMTMKALTIVQGSTGAFQCIDEDVLRTAVGTFGEILQLVQVFNVFEDSLRVGQSQPPALPSGLRIQSFAAATSLVHDMQLHIWILLYLLLKEAIFQFHEMFPTPAEDMFDFLRAVHRNLGLRGICGGSNRAFVRMLKDEFFQMTHVDGYDSEQAQVFYDLYGLNCFLNPNYELIEHHCAHDAFIDRGVALQAVDLLLQQASKLPMKELVKHPLKDTIDKVHGAAPRKRPSDAIMRNREIQRAFLRSPINPLDLYSCLRGEGNQLPVSLVPKDDALLASKGWYFLMGHIALTKYRSQKRTAPTPTEDVDIAIAFFMQDLEYSVDSWETWFRLAQAYDTKIEESVVWSAEKLNNSMLEIVQLQRAAIHCYTLAIALAYRSANLSFETSEKMTELFSDFALRLYASSREPFSMLPFSLDDAEKFLSFAQGEGKGKPFQPLRVYTAWKLAKVLSERALVGKPQSWTLHYMLGKCLWKMHSAPNYIKGPHDVPPTAQQVLDSFLRTIELIAADKKDSREKREPILGPHYKLVTIVHKLVSRGEIGLDRGKEALDNTPYSRSVTFPQEMEEWVPYVLGILKNLRAADKSNWHHRMIARAAHIVYDDSDSRADPAGPSQNLGAMGAKHELTQQMFTKTMVLQVWRPECERAGRHFVYTARYTRFFVQILEQLKDRSNLEMLARRVRRRPHDVFEHSAVWQDICNAYLRLLRSYGALPEGLETSTFSNILHEEFLVRKEPLEKWMQSQDTGLSPALDVLREVQELKKINQSLMKPGPIDDLIGDSYAYLFNTIGKQLWDEDRRIKQEEESRRPPPVVSPPRNPMMSLNHLMNLDGTNESAVQLALPSQPGQLTAPPPAAAAAEQAPARRKIGVGRREIRTCAESCVQKASTGAGAVSSSTAKSLGMYPRVQVVIDASRPTASGEASVESSAPGSIQDSADDESELSELEEVVDEEDNEGVPMKSEEPRRPMFPGLASGLESKEASDAFETADEEPAAEEESVDMDDRPVDSAEGPLNKGEKEVPEQGNGSEEITGA